MADISVAGDELEAAAPRPAGPLPSLAAVLAAEGERRILWAPVWFGSGIAVYFALLVEPPLWLGLAAFAAAISVAVLLWRRRAWRSAALCLALAAAGFALITETTRERAAPMLGHRIGAVALTGRVIDIDTLDRGWRIVMAPDAVPGLDQGLDRVGAHEPGPPGDHDLHHRPPAPRRGPGYPRPVPT